EADEAVLRPRAEQDALGIRQRGAAIERDADAVGGRRDGHDGARWTLGRAVADDEEVVVVPDQFVGARPASPKHAARGLDQASRPGLELGEKEIELPRRTFLFGFHATSAPRNCSS